MASAILYFHTPPPIQSPVDERGHSSLPTNGPFNTNENIPHRIGSHGASNRNDPFNSSGSIPARALLLLFPTRRKSPHQGRARCPLQAAYSQNVGNSHAGRANRPGEPIFPLPLRGSAREPLLHPVNPIQEFPFLARLRLKAQSSQRNPSFVPWCLRERTSFYSTSMSVNYDPNPGTHPKSLRSQIGQNYDLNKSGNSLFLPMLNHARGDTRRLRITRRSLVFENLILGLVSFSL